MILAVIDTSLLSFLRRGVFALGLLAMGASPEVALAQVVAVSPSVPEASLPVREGMDNIWPGDLFSCDHGFDRLCVRGYGGYVVAGAGVASLGVGIGFNVAEIDNAGNQACDDVEPGVACPGQLGEHGLYGRVDGDEYVSSGAGVARGASDGILYGSIGLGGLGSVLWGRRHAVAFAAALGLTMLTTEVLKLAVSNPRPIAWMSADDLSGLSDEEQAEALDEQRSEDSYRSFPSGHTSMTAAATSSVVTIWTMHLLEVAAQDGDYTPAIVVAVVGGAMSAGLTVGVGALRVLGGAHHSADVLVGGFLGAGLGVAVPIAVLAPSLGQHDSERGRNKDTSFMLGVDDHQLKLSGSW